MTSAGDAPDITCLSKEIGSFRWCSDNLLQGDVSVAPIRVKSSEFRERFDALRDLARTKPVVITERGMDELVVLSSEEWKRLRRRDRMVGLAADLPDEWLDAVEAADVPEQYSDLDRLLD